MLGIIVQVWILGLLSAGALTSEQVNVCEQQPCHNGGVCESHAGGYRCLCSPQSRQGRLYGGENCTVELSGCDAGECQNGGICSPLLLDGQHSYSCLCPPGQAGPRCQLSTTFSFESEGFLLVETRHLQPGAALNLTFGFRTERPGGTLLQRRVDDLLLSVQLLDGRLCLLSRRSKGSSTLVQKLPEYLSDNLWHGVEASLGGVVSLIRLLCSGPSCRTDTSASAEVQLLQPLPVPPDPRSVRQSLFIGAVSLNRALGEEEAGDPPPAFLGCFRDVFVDSRLIVLVNGSAPGPSAGCSTRDKCDDSPCLNRGRCVSRGWRSYSCECHRPFEGENCEEEYITARFGNQDLESYAEFSLDEELEDPAVALSMFVRSRQTNGLLLVLANSTGQYLRLWLEGGRLRIQVNNYESLTGPGSVSDGHFHLVTVKLDGTTATLSQSTQTQGSLTIRPVRVQPGDKVFVGGLPDPRASASFGGPFKGCVQDLRINSRRLQFYPIASAVDSYRLERLVGVDEGCGSTNVCEARPCLNGGECYSMWDDFICSCPPNTAGRRCEEVKWCELSPCPTTALCQPLPQGFECLSNVTFRPDGVPLHLAGDGKIRQQLRNLSLSFRSRQPAATLLHAQRGPERLTLSLLDSSLLLELRTEVGGVMVQSSDPLSDGEWHRVEIRRERSTGPSRWVVAVDEAEEVFSGASEAALDFLREGADIFLGGLSVESGVSFSGCLGPVEVGGLLLPFHLDTELNFPRPQEGQFQRRDAGVSPRFGCWGAVVCAPSPCRNGGECRDLFDLRSCSCPPEWTGPLCGEPTDSCHSGPCVHGSCSSRDGAFRCQCEPGFSGERCQEEADPCEMNSCSFGAICLRGVQHYTCLCPRNTTGPYCQEKIPELPWYIETDPLPLLPLSMCTGSRWNYSCFNGGNCSEAEDSCSCLPGFTGQWCELDVDECASEPCMNGGFCINYIDSFECICDMNYSGVYCQMDVSDFYMYLFLGLWQNLFQLVSYLVIRLDDEPEIEWGFNMND